jgi:hypothetical protein
VRNRKRLLAIIVFVLLIFQSELKFAQATTYVKLSGVLTNYKGEFLKAPTGLILRSGGKTVATATLNERGYYEAFFPESEKVELTFLVYQSDFGSVQGPSPDFDDVIFSNWSTTLVGTKDLVVNLQLPKPVRVDIKIVDAQDQLIPESWISEVNGNAAHNKYVDANGYEWAGIQRWNGSSIRWTSKTGLFLFYYYPTDKFDGVRFGKTEIPSYFSGDFPLLSEKSIKLCVPVNFGPTRTMPANCFNEEWAAAKAAADAIKNKAEFDRLFTVLADYQAKIQTWFNQYPELWSANPDLKLILQKGLDFKNIEKPTEKDLQDLQRLMQGSKSQRINGFPVDFRRAESLVNQQIEKSLVAEKERVAAELAQKKKQESKALGTAAKKKLTIICVSGSVTKKVTAANPKCPKGFKKR